MTHLAILAVEAYTINTNEIYELRQEHKRHPFSKLYPYTINLRDYNDNANNNIIQAEYYLQFIGFIKEENPVDYILFDLDTHDNLLGEEISNLGVEDLFKNIDFKKILSNFKIEKYIDKWKTLRAPIYLIVEMKYIGGYDYNTGGDSEFELEINIIGYLNSNLEKVIFDVLKIN